MVMTRLVRLAVCAVCAASAALACKRPEPPPLGLVAEPLRDDGRLPAGVEAMLLGGQRGCRDDHDCESNACSFGACIGLVTADEPWRMEHIGVRVRERLALQPELAPIVRAFLADVATREEMGLAFRGRTVRALGELVDPAAPPDDKTRADVVGALKVLLRSAPGPVGEVTAVTLARLGADDGLDTLVDLTSAKRLASACEALRVLGIAARGKPETRTIALEALLPLLSPDVDLELQRAAIAGLDALGDARATRPLAGYLTTGPEALADETAAVLRRLTRAELGPDALKWDAWVAANTPPPAPAYTPRGHDSVDDIDLPAP